MRVSKVTDVLFFWKYPFKKKNCNDPFWPAGGSKSFGVNLTVRSTSNTIHCVHKNIKIHVLRCRFWLKAVLLLGSLRFHSRNSLLPYYLHFRRSPKAKLASCCQRQTGLYDTYDTALRLSRCHLWHIVVWRLN